MYLADIFDAKVAYSLFELEVPSDCVPLSLTHDLGFGMQKMHCF